SRLSTWPSSSSSYGCPAHRSAMLRRSKHQLALARLEGMVDVTRWNRPVARGRGRGNQLDVRWALGVVEEVNAGAEVLVETLRVVPPSGDAGLGPEHELHHMPVESIRFNRRDLIYGFPEQPIRGLDHSRDLDVASEHGKA